MAYHKDVEWEALAGIGVGFGMFVVVPVVAMLLNIGLCTVLVGPFGVRGLAAAGSIASVLECAGLWLVLHHELGGLGRRQVLRSLVQTVAASVVMGQVMAIALILLRSAGVIEGVPAGALITLGAAGFAGVIAFAVAAGQVRSEEYRVIASRLSA